MSKTNGHAHYAILSKSTLDTIELAKAVEERFLLVFHTHMKMCGMQLTVPHELKKDMIRWRQMCVRHKRQDFRNTLSELESTKSVAQWTVDIHRSLRKQKPAKVAWSC